jgi:putative transcriptional regulator
MITYDVLWETLKKKKITQYALINTYHISAGQLSRMRANANISTGTVNKLCNILNCKVEDIMTFYPDKTGEPEED